MDDILNESNGKLPFEKIDIFCLRMLAEKILKDTAIFFDTAEGRDIY